MFKMAAIAALLAVGCKGKQTAAPGAGSGAGSGSAASPVAVVVDAAVPVALDAAVAVSPATAPTVLTMYTNRPDPDAGSGAPAEVEIKPYLDLAAYCSTTPNPAACAPALATQVTPQTSVKTSELQTVSIITELAADGGQDYSLAVDQTGEPPGKKPEAATPQLYVVPHFAHRAKGAPLAFTQFEYVEGKNAQIVKFAWKDDAQDRRMEVQLKGDLTLVFYSPDGKTTDQ